MSSRNITKKPAPDRAPAEARGHLAAAIPVALFAALVLAAIGLHLRGATGGFLSDDFTHLGWIFAAADRGALGAWVLARFHEPLGNGTFAWRPLAFASYAADWLMWGERAAGWRATSLVLHIANAVLAARIVFRIVQDSPERAQLAPIIAAATLAAFPFAGEASWWPVGRFDLLAAFFSLLCLSTFSIGGEPAARGAGALRVLWLVCALLSKESAFPLPVVVTAWAIATSAAEERALLPRMRAALRAAWVETGACWVAFALVLGARKAIFGTSLKVYPSTAMALDPRELVSRIAGIGSVVQETIGDGALAWGVAAALLIVTIVVSAVASKRWPGERIVALALAFAAALYLVAPSFSIPVFAPYGEGGRHLYLAWVYLSLVCGVALAASAARWMLGFAFVAMMLIAQERSLGQWQQAGARMAAVAAAVPGFAERIGADEYALVLLPDHLRSAPFARDAQAALFARPVQTRDLTNRAVAMLGYDFRGWSGHLAGDTVARFKGVARFDPVNFRGLWCFNPARGAFVPLTPGNIWRDAREWQELAQRNFLSAGCLPPFDRAD